MAYFIPGDVLVGNLHIALMFKTLLWKLQLPLAYLSYDLFGDYLKCSFKSDDLVP